jgi:hypothetical protein
MDRGEVEFEGAIDTLGDYFISGNEGSRVNEE